MQQASADSAEEHQQANTAVQEFDREKIAVEVDMLLQALDHYTSSAPSNHESFTIGLLTDQSVDRLTRDSVRTALSRREGHLAQGRKIRIVEIFLQGDLDLEQVARTEKLDAAFLPEGAKQSIRTALTILRPLKILSMTNQPDYVHWLGVCLGVETGVADLDLLDVEIEEASDQRIMINLSSCPLEGSTFAPELMKNSKVYF